MTLVEAVMAVGITGVLTVAALNATGAAAGRRLAEDQRALAAALARSIADEVASLPFGSPDAQPADSRGEGDSVWSFANTTLSPIGTMGGSDGAIAPAGWWAEVEVAWVLPGTLAVHPTDTGLVEIRVRVMDTTRTLADRRALRARGMEGWRP